MLLSRTVYIEIKIINKDIFQYMFRHGIITICPTYVKTIYYVFFFMAVIQM